MWFFGVIKFKELGLLWRESCVVWRTEVYLPYRVSWLEGLNLKPLMEKGGKCLNLEILNYCGCISCLQLPETVFFSDPGCPTSGRSVSFIYLRMDMNSPIFVVLLLYYHMIPLILSKFKLFILMKELTPSCDVVDNFIHLFSAS